MTSCYYCKDYHIKDGKCTLFNKSISEIEEDCYYFEFDTGMEDIIV